MTNYPAQIDTTTSLPTVVDNSTAAAGVIVNRLRDAILAIEDELGIKPSGIYGTVRSRLDTLEIAINNSQVIKLAGDLGGIPSVPAVIGIQGRPVSTVAPNLNDVYTWDGIAWIPAPQLGSGSGGAAGGDLGGVYPNPKVVGLQGRPISTQAPLLNQALTWNGSAWIPNNTSSTVPPANGSWSQANWYIDWSAGNDANPGTITLPVKTVNGGVVAKWGTISPFLSQDTTLNVVTSQPAGVEQIFLSPVMAYGSHFTINGTKQPVAGPFILSGTTPKNRATPQLLLETLNANHPGGLLVTNTDHPSAAMIFSMAGSVATMCQPLNGTTEVDTWANGDHVTITAPTGLNLVRLAPYAPGFDGLFNPFVTVQNIQVLDQSGGVFGHSSFGSQPESGTGILFQDCAFSASIYATGLGYSQYQNCWCDPLTFPTFKTITYWFGGYVSSPTSEGIAHTNSIIYDLDAIITTSFGSCQLGLVYFATSLRVNKGALVDLEGYNAGVSIWGPGICSIQSSGKLLKQNGAGTWVNIFQLKGAFTLNGISSGSTYTAGVWASGVALTPANLDAHSAIIDPFTTATASTWA